MKALFVCSSGGHLDQLAMLLPPPSGVEVSFATFDKPDARMKVSDYQLYPLVWPTNRSVTALVRNTWRALRIISRNRPDIIVSSGAAAAVPFFYVGKVLGSRTYFVECFDRLINPTLSARLVRPVTDAYLIQADGQLSGYPNRINVGACR